MKVKLREVLKIHLKETDDLKKKKMVALVLSQDFGEDKKIRNHGDAMLSKRVENLWKKQESFYLST